MTPPARVSLYERTPHPSVAGTWQYELVGPPNSMPFVQVPAVGDVIATAGLCVRVVARQWIPASQGSHDWPHGAAAPLVGPLVDLVVEASPSVFVDEGPIPEDGPQE